MTLSLILDNFDFMTGAAAALESCASALLPDALLLVVDPASLSLRGGKMPSHRVFNALSYCF